MLNLFGCSQLEGELIMRNDPQRCSSSVSLPGTLEPLAMLSQLKALDISYTNLGGGFDGRILDRAQPHCRTPFVATHNPSRTNGFRSCASELQRWRNFTQLSLMADSKHGLLLLLPPIPKGGARKLARPVTGVIKALGTQKRKMSGLKPAVGAMGHGGKGAFSHPHTTPRAENLI